MRQSSHWAVATLLALSQFAGANTAEAQAGDPTRPATGPNAEPSPIPEYPTPSPGLIAPAPSSGLTAPYPRSELTLSDMRIEEDGAPFVGKPAPGWRPSEQAGLMLVHEPGEVLDAAWMRRQFAANGSFGQPTTADRIVATVQLINRALVENGYINSGLLVESTDLPANGVLELRLITGRVRETTVEWSEGGARGLGESFLVDRLSASQTEPLNAFDLEQQFRLLAENPALRTLNAALTPGDRPGEANLTLRADPQPRFDLYLGFANDRSPSVGGERASVGGSVRNLIFDGDLLSAEYGVTEGLADTIVTYSSPIFDTRTRVDVLAEANEADIVEPALQPLGIQSESASAELGITRALFQRPLTPAGDAWIDARDIAFGVRLSRRMAETSLLGMPFSFSPGAVDGRTEVTAARLTGEWIERGIERVWAASVIASFGLDGTRFDVPGVAAPEENFTSVLAQVNYARRLPHEIELRGRVAAQWASGVLYTSERFSVGGQDTVRGYRENLLLADTGVLASIELSRTFSLSGGRRSGGVDWGAVSAAIFADGAIVRNEGGPNLAVDSISSVGISLTWAPTSAISAQLSYGVALSDVGVAASDDTQDNGIHFRIKMRPLGLFSGRR